MVAEEQIHVKLQIKGKKYEEEYNKSSTTNQAFAPAGEVHQRGLFAFSSKPERQSIDYSSSTGR